MALNPDGEGHNSMLWPLSEGHNFPAASGLVSTFVLTQ